jgi:hypothetical protein
MKQFTYSRKLAEINHFKVLYSSVIVLFILLFSCTKDDSDKKNCQPFIISDSYQYPIKPGTTEWAALGSLSARIQASIIPQQTLETISTSGLIESLLNYPFIQDYMVSNAMQTGFEFTKSQNPGFSELYGRSDIYNEFYDRYKLMSVSCQNIYPPFRGNDGVTQISFEVFELFIFQDDFLDELTEEQRSEIFKLVYEKLQLKTNNDYADNFKLVSTAILGTIMYKNAYQPFVEECLSNQNLMYFIINIPKNQPSAYLIPETTLGHAENYYNSL